MSIDEVSRLEQVIDLAEMSHNVSLDDVRAAIEQHVAEEVAKERERRAKERERRAKMADEYATWGGSNFYDWFKKLATAIRARGTT